MQEAGKGNAVRLCTGWNFDVNIGPLCISTCWDLPWHWHMFTCPDGWTGADWYLSLGPIGIGWGLPWKVIHD